MQQDVTTLSSLLAQVSDAELEDGFEDAMAGLNGKPWRDGETGWYSGAEIRELLATRTERRQARVDELEAELVVA